jgi:hypothetical protein
MSVRACRATIGKFKWDWIAFWVQMSKHLRAGAASRNARTLAVSGETCEFISENHHIESIRRLVAALPETLRS